VQKQIDLQLKSTVFAYAINCLLLILHYLNGNLLILFFSASFTFVVCAIFAEV